MGGNGKSPHGNSMGMGIRQILGNGNGRGKGMLKAIPAHLYIGQCDGTNAREITYKRRVREREMKPECASDCHAECVTLDTMPSQAPMLNLPPLLA